MENLPLSLLNIMYESENNTNGKKVLNSQNYIIVMIIWEIN